MTRAVQAASTRSRPYSRGRAPAPRCRATSAGTTPGTRVTRDNVTRDTLQRPRPALLRGLPVAGGGPPPAAAPRRVARAADVARHAAGPRDFAAAALAGRVLDISGYIYNIYTYLQYLHVSTISTPPVPHAAPPPRPRPRPRHARLQAAEEQLSRGEHRLGGT